MPFLFQKEKEIGLAFEPISSADFIHTWIYIGFMHAQPYMVTGSPYAENSILHVALSKIYTEFKISFGIFSWNKHHT